MGIVINKGNSVMIAERGILRCENYYGTVRVREVCLNGKGCSECMYYGLMADVEDDTIFIDGVALYLKDETCIQTMTT